MPTVIRISGNRDSIVSAVEKSGLPFRESIQSLRQGTRSKSRSSETTFNLVVSEADGDSVPQQILDTRQFLIAHAKSLANLMNDLENQSKVIDFSWDLATSSIGQSNRFPCDLLYSLASLDLQLEISVYRVE
ncbi:MAG: hypothetical protein ACK5YR_18995 [Pirellula sp.]